jgi:hypothetical protein
MNKLLTTLVAGTFAVAASSAFAQAGVAGTPSPAMQKEAAKDPKGSAAAYANPAAEQTQAQKSQAGAAAVAKSKEQPRTKSKYDEKTAQQLVDTGTDPAQQKANVAASKAASPKRERMPDISKLTKEQQNELLRQLQKANTGG